MYACVKCQDPRNWSYRQAQAAVGLQHPLEEQPVFLVG